MMLSEKLGVEFTVREIICQDFVIRTKTIVLVNATVAAPLKLSMSIPRYLLIFVLVRISGDLGGHCDAGHIGHDPNA